jgi:hypothetical protein
MKHRDNGLRGRGGREDRRKRQQRIDAIKRGGTMASLAKAASGGSVARLVDALVPAIGAYAARRKQEGLAEIEAAEALEPAFRPLTAGDVVVLTGKVLGAIYGEANDQAGRVWSLQACECELCALGRHVCTSEWADEYGAFKHIAKAAIKRRGELSADDCSYRGKCPSLERRSTNNRRVR